MSTDRQAKIKAASKDTGKGANAIVVGGIVAIVAVIAIVAGVIWSSQKDAPEVAGGPPAGTEMGQPFNPFPDAKLVDGAPTVDVYEDTRCPACAVFEQLLGGTINSLAEEGKIQLNVHLKTVIDSNDGSDNSAVSGSSMLCAADQGKWAEFHEWIFANQPPNHGPFTQSALKQGAESAGITGDALDTFVTCSEGRAYQEYVQSVDESSAKAGFTGTPAIVVNGTKLSWGAFVNEDGSQVDTEAFTKVLTSGDVPADKVAKE